MKKVKSDNLIYLIIVVVVVLMLAFGMQRKEQVEIVDTVEESIEPEVPETVIVAVEEEDTSEPVEEVKVAEPIEEEIPEAVNTINLGNKFLIYYDFSEGEFIDKRQLDSDTFSKRYKTYIVFTRFDPANVKVIDKNIDDVEIEDCIGIKGQFEYLYSRQSLCVTTKEGIVVALGGSWEDTENAELIWKVLS